MTRHFCRVIDAWAVDCPDPEKCRRVTGDEKDDHDDERHERRWREGL